MNNSLLFIQQKIDKLQNGLLRFHDKTAKITLHVKATTNDDESFNCIVEGGFDKKLCNKNVNLIQKSYNDYLYVTGKVSAETQNGAKILSIRITKACWFEKMKKGSVVWLKEKYTFTSPNLEAAV
jgi:hypothetical protein